MQETFRELHQLYHHIAVMVETKLKSELITKVKTHEERIRN